MKSQCKAERNQDDNKIKNINKTEVFALLFVSMKQKLFFFK